MQSLLLLGLDDVRIDGHRDVDMTVPCDGLNDMRWCSQRETEQIRVTDELAEAFGLSPDEEITHTVTRASEGGRPVSISDTYQPLDVADAKSATVLEESVADRLPTPAHAEWLRTTPGDLVKTVHQRFLEADGRVIMVSDMSYPRDRYDAFVFRMALTPEA